MKVVVLSANEDRGSIDGALGAGASSYIVTSVDAADVASVVRQTACGNVFHPVMRGHGRADTSSEPQPHG